MATLTDEEVKAARLLADRPRNQLERQNRWSALAIGEATALERLVVVANESCEFVAGCSDYVLICEAMARLADAIEVLHGIRQEKARLESSPVPALREGGAL